VTQYAVHKVFNEWQAKEYSEKHGMTVTGIRAAHISGADKLIGSVDHVRCIVEPALGKAARFKFADTMRCVVHADDIAEVFARVALCEKPRYGLYNSGGETVSLAHLANMVRATLPSADISFENESGGESGSTAYRFDNSRLTEEFGIVFPPYRDRVQQMIEEVRSN
jgi:nucleoside-diphosphate-sugar epimerase